MEGHLPGEEAPLVVVYEVPGVAASQEPEAELQSEYTEHATSMFMATPLGMV